jgi:MYXO-CTERM domain-containing protein
MAFLSVFVSCFLLLAVSITEVGLVSDMVGFLHNQKTRVKNYQVNWTNNTVFLDALPAHLFLNQGHTTNGAAGYGFVLGVAGLFVAWRQRRRNGKVCIPRHHYATFVLDPSFPTVKSQPCKRSI